MEEESQRHLLICPNLSDYSVMNGNTIIYEDLLGFDCNKIELIGKILMKRFKLLLSNNHAIIAPLCTDNYSSCAASKEELE